MSIELALILGLVAALGFLVWEYIRLHRLFEKTHYTREQTNEAIHRKALSILDQARESAAKILSEARIGAAAHRERLSAKMDAALSAVANREIGDFKKALETETINIEKAVGQKIAARYDEVNREVEKYKAKQITAAEEKVNKVLQTILQKILSKTINPHEHQELVIKSLEEARKHGLFN